MAGAAIDDDGFDAGTAVAQRFIGCGLEFDDLTAAVAAVGGDEHLRAGVIDTVLERLGGKAAEHHGMDGADAGAGLHGDHRLGDHGHVDDYPVAVGDAVGLEGIGKAAYFCMKLCITQGTGVALLAFKDDGDLIGLIGQLAVQTIVGHIEQAVVKPAVLRCGAVVEGALKGLVPGNLPAGHLPPETAVVFRGATVQGLQIGSRFYARLGDKGGGWRELPFFLQDGIDILVAHCVPHAIYAGARDSPMLTIAEARCTVWQCLECAAEAGKDAEGWI